jgi:hypothetical protein
MVVVRAIEAQRRARLDVRRHLLKGRWKRVKSMRVRTFPVVGKHVRLEALEISRHAVTDTGRAGRLRM